MVRDLKEAASPGGEGPVMPWSISTVEHFLHSSLSLHLVRSKAVQSLKGQSHTTLSEQLLGGSTSEVDHSAHGYGDINSQVAIVRKQLGNGGVKNEAVRVHDGRADSLMDRSWCSFPSKTAPMAI